MPQEHAHAARLLHIDDPATRQLLVKWLQNERPSDLVGGRLIEKRTTTLLHGAAQGGVGAQLFLLQGTSWWLTQGVDLYLDGDGLRPDLAGWRIDRCPAPPSPLLIEEPHRVIVAPPDWVCEILSTQSAAEDLDQTKRAYERAGVSWYWRVCVPTLSVSVYRHTVQGYKLCRTATPGAPVVLPPFETLAFRVDALLPPECV